MSLPRTYSGMEKIIEDIPVSLYKEVSARLSSIVLSARNKDALPTDLVKRIIFLWRQDQLESKAGVRALLEAAEILSPEDTSKLLSELGLQKLAKALRNTR